MTSLQMPTQTNRRVLNKENRPSLGERSLQGKPKQEISDLNIFPCYVQNKQNDVLKRLICI